MADSEAIKAWYGIRVKAIHERITVYDLLRSNGIVFKHTGEREEQFSCPFHGKDESPSARVYPSSARSPSHAWCFVCRERWDVISLWKKYHGSDGKNFHRILSEIEKQYGLTAPPIPEGGFRDAPVASDQQRQDFDKMYEACERRLLSVREDYRQIGDMHGYLMAGSVLDKVFYQVSEGKLNFVEGIDVLNRLLKKIAERLRGGPKN